MWRIGFTSVFVIAAAALTGDAASAAEPTTIDLTQWVAPDITRVGDDPFGQLVKYGYALFTDTADQIGPTAPETARRFAGNNLACRNCHLNGGTQPYAMPMIGIWGQFPSIGRGRVWSSLWRIGLTAAWSAV